MTDRHDDSVGEVLGDARLRRIRFAEWLAQLRDCDLRFAEASRLDHDDNAEWQAAVYLLTGCDVVWARLRARVLEERSLTCVLEALEREDSWTPRQLAVMRWAAHFCDARRECGGFPRAFGEFCFRRWVTAVHLRQSVAPALTIIDARRA